MRRRNRPAGPILAPLTLSEPLLADWARPGDAEAVVTESEWRRAGLLDANVPRHPDDAVAAATLRWWEARRAWLASHPGSTARGGPEYTRAELATSYPLLREAPIVRRYRKAPPGTPDVIWDYSEMAALRESLEIRE